VTQELNPSPALKRAAAAEARRIERARLRLHRRREQLEAQMRQMDTELAGLAERERQLASLVAAERLEPEGSGGRQDSAESGASVMRGARLREHAATVLVREAGAGVPMHYRDWFAKVLESGVRVSAKDPLGSFLTNVSRSPIISRGEASGTYYADPERLETLRAEMAEKAAELRDVADVIRREARAPRRLREHQVELTADLSRLESLVAEGERVLGVAAHRKADGSTVRDAA
jgi:hypothetical protein